MKQLFTKVQMDGIKRCAKLLKKQQTMGPLERDIKRCHPDKRGRAADQVRLHEGKQQDLKNKKTTFKSEINRFFL